jgi:hypothetical protein
MQRNNDDDRNNAERPLEVFGGPRLTRQETRIKRRVDAYITSEIDHSELMRVGGKTYRIQTSLDLPDLVCSGLKFKRRLVQVQGGNCYLMARWKPERHMRRLAEPNSQKWFFAIHEQRAAEQAEKEAR